MSKIEVNNLYFSYGEKKVLNDISFKIKDGESFGIIGPNGCGKTTLLRGLTGLCEIKSGIIKINGNLINDIDKKELAKQIAVVEQDGTPALSFTVEEIIAMGRYPWKKPFSSLTEEDYDIINESIDTFDLGYIRDRMVDTLSGGQRQMVSLARAMVQEPNILFLDEPTTFLDIGNQQLIMQFVRKWQKEKNITVIMVLHDLNLAAQYCDRLLLINQTGSIQVIGNVEDVIKEEEIESVYHIKPTMIIHPTNKVPQILMG